MKLMLLIRELSSKWVDDLFCIYKDGTNLLFRLQSPLVEKKHTLEENKYSPLWPFLFLFVLFWSVRFLFSHHTRYFFLSLLPKKFLWNIFFFCVLIMYFCWRKKIVSKNCLLSTTKLFPLYSSLHRFDLLHCRRVSLS